MFTLCALLTVLVFALAVALTYSVRRRRPWPATATQFRALFEEAPIAYLELDRHGVIRRVNRAGCELLGYPPSEVTGKPVWDFVSPSLREILRTSMLDRLSGGEATQAWVEQECIASDGGSRLVRIYERLIRDQTSGEIVGIRAALLDVTGRRDAEQALQESEERYRNLIDNAPIGIYRATVDGRFLIANPALVHLLGYGSFEELAARMPTREESETGFDRAEFQARLERDVEILGREAVWTRSDGQAIAVRENLRLVRGESGAALYYEGAVEDVTARKLAEAALAEANSKLEAVIRQSPLAVITLDPDGTVKSWNPSAERLFGWTEPEVLHTKLPVVPDPEHCIEESRKGKALVGCERRGTRKDGSEVEATFWTALLHDAAGDVRGLVAMVADNTKRKEDEAKLRESEERYRDLFQNANDIVISTDLAGRFTSANKATEQATGYTRAELMAMNMTALLAAGEGERAKETIDAMLAGAPLRRYELAVIAKKGQRIALEITSRVLFQDGRPSRIQSIARDITERKQWEHKIEEYGR